MIMERLTKGEHKAQQFNISNIGQSDLAIDEIELIGGDSYRFSVDPGTCQNLTPIIWPGGSCINYGSICPWI